MSMCDVPLCPNLSVSGAQPLLAVARGLPRVGRIPSETRDRLRIRLHQRKESLRANNKNGPKLPVCKDAAPGTRAPPRIPPEPAETAEKPNKVTVNDKSLTTIIRNAGIQACAPKLPSPPKENGGVVKRGDGGSAVLPDSSGKASRLATVRERDKENRVVDDAAFGACEDIDTIMNFIEGKEGKESVEKKAAKKARQKLRKEEERRKREQEEERKRKAEEERIRQEKLLEEIRLREEMLAQKALLKKAKKNCKPTPAQQQPQHETSKGKKKNKKTKLNHVEASEPESLEETIPAMVTIKRIVENNNSPPTVTITLKGSTPDQDKLLYTLVNGHNNRKCPDVSNPETKPSKKKKSEKKGKEEKMESITTKELKVTIAVDKSFRKDVELRNQQQSKGFDVVEERSKVDRRSEKAISKESVIDIPSLKLPPGITITKVNGPLTTRKSNNVQSSDYDSVPVNNKAGVIVVDTEKLIQQTKKNKKKKKKSQGSGQSTEPNSAQSSESMVTLKNPIFHKIQSKLTKPESVPNQMININEQATISKGENGMVTIRRPRGILLQNESPISKYCGTNLSPVIGKSPPQQEGKGDAPLAADKRVIKPPSSKASTAANVNDEPPREFDGSRLSAQNMLWGLPGIQITRVNKNSPAVSEADPVDQTADVSIIRTGGFNLEKDDWPYESVFTPKDILEDDLDADERELEAFKRFCQQSVPPKHKEKVAHLNVKDIVLMKKNDVTYS